jgi:CRISPR/Cas system CMR-associated protein Cmr5 small subunit
MNLEQARGHAAFSFVQSIPDGRRADFLGVAQKLPVMLQTNGLLATWAHLVAKGGPARVAAPAASLDENALAARALLDHLRPHAPANLFTAADGTVEALLALWRTEPAGASGVTLRRLTAEAIRYSVWLKRAAEALLSGSTGEAAVEGGR